MSDSRVASRIRSIPTLIKLDLIWMSAAESREAFHADIDNYCGKALSISVEFIFKLRLTSLTADCQKTPQHSTESRIYITEPLVTCNAPKTQLPSGRSSVSERSTAVSSTYRYVVL